MYFKDPRNPRGTDLHPQIVNLAPPVNLLGGLQKAGLQPHFELIPGIPGQSQTMDLRDPGGIDRPSCGTFPSLNFFSE